MNNKFRYAALSESELQNRWDKHKNIIEDFLSENKYDQNCIFVNEKVILSIITKVHQRQKYFKYFHGLDMSEYKEAALNAFWYIKLRPIMFRSDVLAEQLPGEYDSINEKLAVYYLLRTLRLMLIKHKKSEDQLDTLSRKYLRELVYTFTYRDISKEAIIMLIETMAIFLGLDPYAPVSTVKTPLN